MSDRTKEIILKVLIVIGFVLMCLDVFGIVLLSFLVSYETLMRIFTILFVAMCSVGILFMILLPIFGGLKQKTVKAEKLPVLFASYSDFWDFLQTQLLQKGYQIQGTESISKDADVTVCIKPSKQWTLTCVTVVRVLALSKELIEDANESITNILGEYYGGKTITASINMISVFCVDRITPSFQKLMNSNMQQGFKNGRLVVGLSFGGKNMYIAKQKEGFAITKYKRLKKEFLNIIGVQNTNKRISVSVDEEKDITI